MSSQINPNNINANYPVAGVPNNTQGFRDNFTAIQTNFQYTANEINDLQDKAVLKAALSGGVLDNNMNDNLLYAVKLNDVSWTEVQQVATSGTITLDYSAGTYQAIPSATGNITLGFSNWPATGSVGSLHFAIVVTNVAYTLTLPDTVKVGLPIVDGISPGTPGVSNTITFPATGTYVYVFETADGGNTISIQQTITPERNIYANYVFNGTSYMGFGAANGNANISIGATSNVVVVSTTGQYVTGINSVTGNVVTAGNVVLTDGGKVGYGVGAGGTVSQSGNKTGGVTLNKPSGEITMQNTALGAATIVSFVLTNSTIANTDLLAINHVSGGTIGAYTFNASCNAGNATIYVRNNTAGSLSEALVLRYAVIKGSVS